MTAVGWLEAEDAIILEMRGHRGLTNGDARKAIWDRLGRRRTTSMCCNRWKALENALDGVLELVEAQRGLREAYNEERLKGPPIMRREELLMGLSSKVPAMQPKLPPKPPTAVRKPQTLRTVFTQKKGREDQSPKPRVGPKSKVTHYAIAW